MELEFFSSWLRTLLCLVMKSVVVDGHVDGMESDECMHACRVMDGRPYNSIRRIVCSSE